MREYTLIRSRRKTIAIHITKDAGVEVRAPMKIAKADIDKLVTEKEKWIKSHLEKREMINDEQADFSLNYNDIVTFCGKPYSVCACDGNNAGFNGEYFYLPSGLSSDSIKQTVVQIYKKLAKNIITKKVSTYAEVMNVIPAAVKINSAKTRWGSCSGKNSLNFSWRLVMADEAVIDYVVVHELAHIKEHNHSSRFWAVVEGILPDYRQCRQDLKELQNKLSREDW